MLQDSVGAGKSLFTSWEPGRIDQFYFITTKSRVKRAEERLDATMDHLLNKYGVQHCVRVFGSKVKEMPMEESKVRSDSYIMEYIQTLDIGINLHREREREGKERSPPKNHPAKKRALIVYGKEEGDHNAWNIPLIPTNNKKNLQELTLTETFDLTKDENETTASTETISQLSQYLFFFRKDFNESIKSRTIREMRRILNFWIKYPPYKISRIPRLEI